MLAAVVDTRRKKRAAHARNGELLALPFGPVKGHVVELDQMLPEFYRLRGWDEDGVPTEAKLTKLGLER